MGSQRTSILPKIRPINHPRLLPQQPNPNKVLLLDIPLISVRLRIRLISMLQRRLLVKLRRVPMARSVSSPNKPNIRHKPHTLADSVLLGITAMAITKG
jgi:hypothetical protein